MRSTLLSLLDVALITGGLLATVVLLVWAERRFLGFWQDRLGPNRVGPLGLFQVVADAVKLLAKEDWTPPFADRVVFVIAPAITIVTLMAAFAIVPVSPRIDIVGNLDIGILFFLAMSSLAVYSVVLGGWASNNKYSLLGGLRAAAQMISYEVFMGLALMGVVMLAGTFSLRGIVEAQRSLWFCIPQFIGFIIFLIAGIAESHRLPFDLPEAENELTAGYHTEYSAMKFGMFFLGEYVGMVVVSGLIVTLFFGGWLGPFLPGWLWFILKVAVFLGFFILLRAALPRPRYDQLMAFGWKAMLPLSLLNIAVTGGVLLALGGLR